MMRSLAQLGAGVTRCSEANPFSSESISRGTERVDIPQGRMEPVGKCVGQVFILMGQRLAIHPREQNGRSRQRTPIGAGGNYRQFLRVVDGLGLEPTGPFSSAAMTSCAWSCDSGLREEMPEVHLHHRWLRTMRSAMSGLGGHILNSAMALNAK
jgi:hypothetical protein